VSPANTNLPEPSGLYAKYVVFKAKDVRAVPHTIDRYTATHYEAPLTGILDDCFVLRPKKDAAARAALLAYADHTPDKNLARDLRAWITRAYQELTKET
jgi:hypothetical protein